MTGSTARCLAGGAHDEDEDDDDGPDEGSPEIKPEVVTAKAVLLLLGMSSSPYRMVLFRAAGCTFLPPG